MTGISLWIILLAQTTNLLEGVIAMETRMSRQKIVSQVLRAVAMAMPIAVIVLQTLGAGTPSGLISLLGIGLFALALAALQPD